MVQCLCRCSGREGEYLDIALDIDRVELLACYCEVRMNVIVVHLEMLIRHIWQFLEEEGELDACCVFKSV